MTRKDDSVTVRSNCKKYCNNSIFLSPIILDSWPMKVNPILSPRTPTSCLDSWREPLSSPTLSLCTPPHATPPSIKVISLLSPVQDQTMAEAVLFNIAEDLLKNMASKALEEIAAAWGFKDQLEKLRDTTTTIKDVLSDAERKQVESAAVRGWLEKLRVVVYDADDLFDEFSTMVTRKELMKGSKLSKEARLFFSSSNQLAFAFKMAREVKKIRERLDDAVKNADQFAFRRLHGNDGPSVSLGSGQQTISYVAANEVIGRDEDKKAIIDILLDANVQESISVVSIFGIGGMGKTALAQLVYNDEKIQSHFELKLWACVSDVFDMKEVVRKILASSSDTKIQEMEIEQLQRQLRKLIDGKKYLLVLDDVWNEDPAKWLELRGLLTVGGTGSRILLTTRSSLVAKVAGANPSYDLKGLSEEKSWSLFERMAFEAGKQHDNPKLVELGKEIVQKCANVPLAIRVLGGHLKVGDESTWRHFKESELARISEGGDGVMSILKISYHHLESSLKNCFAYCALFPKDYKMDKETLIYLWMAEGFLVPKGRSLEDTGEDYFKTLLQRGFFQDVTRDELGGIRSCKMHDLMHDLACRVAGNESKVIELGTRDIDKGPHHLSFGQPLSSSSVIPTSLFQLKSLRTFLLPVGVRGLAFSKTLCCRIISSFSCLRVLDLHDFGIETLPSSIGALVHLRYLDLSGTPVTQLPASITKLQNLQILKLNRCWKLEVLPKDVQNLINLRHLGLDGRNCLSSMPAGIGRLTALHKLDVFIVGIDHRAYVSETKTARLSDLKALDKLSGRLHIKILGEMKDPVSEAKEANLSSKHGLSELHLGGYRWDDTRNDEAVLDGLRPPPNLRKLQIGAYRGQMLPTWASMGSLNRFLPNLVVVELMDWGSCLNVPLFSRLRSLKRLSLFYLKSVEYMENSRYDASSSSSSTSFFPSLEVLELWNMDKLKSWWWMEAGASVDAGQRTSTSTSSTEVQPQHIQLSFFPRLLKLSIRNCPSLKSMPLCPNVEELELVRVNKELRVLTPRRASASHRPRPALPSFSICHHSSMGSIRSGGAYCSIDQHLVEQLNLVKPLMDEAEMKHFYDGKVREWLLNIKHTIYDANILLDEIETEARFKEHDELDGSSYSSYIHSISNQDITSEIKNIIEKLVDLAEEGRCMRLTDRVAGAADSYHQMQIPPDRFTKTPLFLGRKEEREQIMAWVLSSADENVVDTAYCRQSTLTENVVDPAVGKLFHIAGRTARKNKVDAVVIVGEGGYGKTALAEYVYNHAEVSRRFVRSCFCICCGYSDLTEVTRAILESLGQRAFGLSTFSELKKRLEEELGGKRFLVILDDVWVTSRDNWEELMALFSSGVQGSKIIVTARDHRVASVVSSDYVVELKPMSVEDGWSLFSSNVFPDGDLSRRTKLEAIGKKIVLKCDGLPLAIKVLGGLLRCHQDEKLWENVLESSLWEIPFYDKRDKPYLVISYSFLPSHLKRCFAHCCLFPRGYVFSGEELVNLWIDEGFVQPTNDGRSMEDVGQSFLEELTSRSLFIKDKYGSGYTMHDFIHDLAQRVSEDFHERVDRVSLRFRDNDGKKIRRDNDGKKTRHVSFQESISHWGYINEGRLAELTPKSLQTFMTFHASPSHPRWYLRDRMLEAILLKQHSLRVLCLRGTRILTLPDTISNLKLLRYLDVSYTDVKQLPASLFTLYTLRRLQCVGCDQLEAFDTEMAGLVSLRHFTLEGKRLHKAPRHLWQLKECSVKAGFCLPYHVQKGQVNVDEANPDDGVRVSINIGKSAFSYSVPDDGLFARADHSDLLESLRPHRDLQEVSIHFFNGTSFPAWLVYPSYHNVASVELKHCQISCGRMPALGQLPSLRYLRLEDVGHMKTLGPEFYGCNDPFRSLEELFFEDMKEWEVWEHDVAAGICFFPRLAKLYLLNCPRLKSRLPAQLPALKEFVLRDCRSFVFSEDSDFPGSFPAKGSLSTSLTSLRIKSFSAWKKLDVIGLQSLVFLEELEIDDCPMLETLPGESLALSSDEDEGSVDHFPMLEALPEESLPLSSDEDEYFPVDDEFLLSSLTTLSIRNCVNLKTLDGGWLRSLTSLHELLISGCRKLESLPEEGLRSCLTLKKLCIYSCPMLEALPEDGLPRSLEVLRLCWNHPKLRERCRRDIGPDWHKIAHVPEIRIR